MDEERSSAEGHDLRSAEGHQPQEEITVEELLDRYAAGTRVFRNIKIAQANLNYAYLEGANLHGAYLEGANLEGANLEDAILNRANLEDAHLARANLYRARLEGAYLEGANLEGANLDGANLAGAYLARANLYGANLEDANLARANLYGANLEDANLARANLNYAHLAGAQGIVTFTGVGAEMRLVYLYAYEGVIFFQMGCFKGTYEEAVEAITEKYDTSDLRRYLPAYLAMLEAARMTLIAQLERKD